MANEKVYRCENRPPLRGDDPCQYAVDRRNISESEAIPSIGSEGPRCPGKTASGADCREPLIEIRKLQKSRLLEALRSPIVLTSVVVVLLVAGGLTWWLLIRPPGPEVCPDGQSRDSDGGCSCPSGQIQGSDGRCYTPPRPPGCPEAQKLAEEAFEQGVKFSKNIAAISTWETFLSKYRKPADTSPGNPKKGVDIIEAEQSLEDLQTEQMSRLQVYSDKLHELSRKEQQEITCAFDALRHPSVPLSSRKQRVLELLSKHVKSARGATLDLNQLSFDLNQEFKGKAD